MPAPDTDTRRLSIAEYADLQEPDDVRSELVRGVLVREPRPGAYHGRTQVRLGRLLDAYAEKHEAGLVLTDVGIVLSRDPPTVRGPDIAFYSSDRTPDPLPRGFLEVAPDLAVEILSPSNRAGEIQEKVGEYLDAGARMVWVLDPASGTATVYRSRDEIRMLTADDELDGEDVLPGFRASLADISPGG